MNLSRKIRGVNRTVHLLITPLPFQLTSSHRHWLASPKPRLAAPPATPLNASCFHRDVQVTYGTSNIRGEQLFLLFLPFFVSLTFLFLSLLHSILIPSSSNFFIHVHIYSVHWPSPLLLLIIYMFIIFQLFGFFLLDLNSSALICWRFSYFPGVNLLLIFFNTFSPLYIFLILVHCYYILKNQ